MRTRLPQRTASSPRIAFPALRSLEGAIGQMKAILRGSEDNAIATFNASHRSIKDAIKRATELDQALSEPRLQDLDRARDALKTAWPFLRGESDVSEDLRAKAAELDDLWNERRFIENCPRLTNMRRPSTPSTRADLTKLWKRGLPPIPRRSTGWCRRLDGMASIRTSSRSWRLRWSAEKREPEQVPIPQLRSERDACETRLQDAIAELHRIVDGDRVATVKLGGYFSGGSRDRRAARCGARGHSRGMFAPDWHRQEGDCPVIGAHHG